MSALQVYSPSWLIIIFHYHNNNCTIEYKTGRRQIRWGRGKKKKETHSCYDPLNMAMTNNLESSYKDCMGDTINLGNMSDDSILHGYVSSQRSIIYNCVLHDNTQIARQLLQGPLQANCCIYLYICTQLFRTHFTHQGTGKIITCPYP